MRQPSGLCQMAIFIAYYIIYLPFIPQHMIDKKSVLPVVRYPLLPAVFPVGLGFIPITIRKARLRKKAHKPLGTLWISQTNVSVMFDNHKTSLLWLQNKRTFHIHVLALHDLRQVFRSCDLDVLRNKGSWAFLSDYPQSNKVEKPDHMVTTTSKATRGVHKVESKKGKEISSLQTMAFLFTSDLWGNFLMKTKW